MLSNSAHALLWLRLARIQLLLLSSLSPLNLCLSWAMTPSSDSVSSKLLTHWTIDPSAHAELSSPYKDLTGLV